MRQRVAYGFDQRLVELGLLSFHLETDLLAALESRIAYQPRELAPHGVDGLHAGSHDALLQLAGDRVETLRAGQKAGVLLGGATLQHLVANQDQFARQVHQLIELFDVDADVRRMLGETIVHGLGGGVVPAG
jgi:hypothetical protein